MSRFYEALREASRTPAKPNGKSEEGAAEGVGAAGGNAAGIPVPALEKLEVIHQIPEPEIPAAASNLLQQELLERAKVSLNGSASRSEEASQNGSPQPEVDTALPIPVEVKFDPSARLITQAADTVVVEHYRRLRTKILQQHAAKPFKSLLVTSPNPQEGKTLTVLNLGLSFAMLPDFKVLIVDGDLRRGTIGKFLHADEHPGLNDLIAGTAQLNDAILRCPDLPVHFLVRGNSKVPPAELLNSPHVAGLFQRMTEEFDLVLVDSPPVNLITDAQLLAGNCDAVLLIARAFSTTRKALEQAARELNAFRIIGTVLNGGTRAQLYRRYSGYYS